MSLTGIVTKLWLLAAVVVVIAIVLERKLPDASEPLKISDLSKGRGYREYSKNRN